MEWIMNRLTRTSYEQAGHAFNTRQSGLSWPSATLTRFSAVLIISRYTSNASENTR